MALEELYGELEKIVVEEYSRIIEKAREKYGPFTPPKVYIPKLYEEQWKRELLPPQDTAKFYGTVYFPHEGPFFVINTWALTREMEVFGKDHVRAKVRETLCHELIHFLRQGLPEVEINVEGEKLIRLLTT